jgi:hypothetical protein
LPVQRHLRPVGFLPEPVVDAKKHDSLFLGYH